LIFIRGLQGLYGKGLVGHCTSGHSLNPPLDGKKGKQRELKGNRQREGKGRKGETIVKKA